MPCVSLSLTKGRRRFNQNESILSPGRKPGVTNGLIVFCNNERYGFLPIPK
jgi:hypothetical protein